MDWPFCNENPVLLHILKVDLKNNNFGIKKLSPQGGRVYLTSCMFTLQIKINSMIENGFFSA